LNDKACLVAIVAARHSLWQSGFMAIWLYGNLALWQFGFIKFGFMKICLWPCLFDKEPAEACKNISRENIA